jgi:hypothetical protein
MQDPKTPTQYTASDILNLIASILQSDASIAAFQAQGVGVLRVTGVRNPYFLDDRQQNEACPSLDVTFTHKQVVASTAPVVQSVDVQVLCVPDIVTSPPTHWDGRGRWDAGGRWDE